MGIKAQVNGKRFEQIFLMSCNRTKCIVTRIPDGCKQLGAGRIIRVRSPFDWIITYEGRTALLDTKTSQGLVFRGSNVPEHQLRHLLNHELAGGTAGFVVHLKEAEVVLFIPATAVYSNPGSFSETHKDVIKLGTDIFDPRLIFGKPGKVQGPVCPKCGKDAAPDQKYCSRACAPYGNMVQFYHRDP